MPHAWVHTYSTAIAFRATAQILSIMRCGRCAQLFPYSRPMFACEGYWKIKPVNDNWPKRSPAC
jgi:hypothetical protein